MNEEWRLVTSSKAYQDYVVFVDSKALEDAARRSICAKCASSVHTIRSARSSSGLRIPDRLIDFRQLSIQQYSLFQTLMIHETVHERL
jgi:hypothetical protein